MSADNTIIIAKFPNGEYRVAEGGASENLDDETYGDLYRVLWFKNAPVFKTFEESWNAAVKIEESLDIVEYGICPVEYDLDLLPLTCDEAHAKLNEMWGK